MTPGEPDIGPGIEADPDLDGIIDWSRTARRMRRSATIVGAIVVVSWIVGALVGDGFHGGDLAARVGFGLMAMFVIEVVVVGGAAARGMLRAGERGHRLSTHGVGLLPTRRGTRNR